MEEYEQNLAESTRDYKRNAARIKWQHILAVLFIIIGSLASGLALSIWCGVATAGFGVIFYFVCNLLVGLITRNDRDQG